MSVEVERPNASVARASPSAASGVAVVRRGTALDSNPSHLSVLAYNLLAPIYVRTHDSRTGGVQKFAAFEWAEPASEVLDWEARCPRLLDELRVARADVLCLQEVQFELRGGSFSLPAWLQGLCADTGYIACLPAYEALVHIAERNLRVLGQEAAVGTALMYRGDRLEALPDRSGEKFSTQAVGVFLKGRADGALASLGPTAIFSAHLDAKDEEQRVQQLRRCMALARQAGTREVILAGDMNTECLPGSCVAALLSLAHEPSQQELARECATALRMRQLGVECADEANVVTVAEPREEQLQEWADLRRRAAASAQEFRIFLSHVHTGPTRAGYDHGKSCGPCVSWRLDHIFYTSRTLQLCASWDALENDPQAASVGLPNRTCPSDHLPVAAVFAPVPTPELQVEKREELLRCLEKLQEAQEADLASLAAQLESVHAACRESANKDGDADEAGSPPKKKARKKKGRASAEEQAAVHERRRQLRELREQHVKARSVFWAGLSELEQDALEAHDLCGAEWIETGERRRSVWTLRARAKPTPKLLAKPLDKTKEKLDPKGGQ